MVFKVLALTLTTASDAIGAIIDGRLQRHVEQRRERHALCIDASIFDEVEVTARCIITYATASSTSRRSHNTQSREESPRKLCLL